MYYGLRCYNKDGEALGWLYTYHHDTEIVWTVKDLSWCKRWKTERGAQKHFEAYNSRWQFKSSGGYLKIEVMPSIEEPESAYCRRQKLLEEWGNETVKIQEDDQSPTLSFRPKPKILEWLKKEKWTYDNGEPEPDTVLLNRKLEKLMELELQGF